jgi:hypothetical protein
MGRLSASGSSLCWPRSAAICKQTLTRLDRYRAKGSLIEVNLLGDSTGINNTNFLKIHTSSQTDMLHWIMMTVLE